MYYLSSKASRMRQREAQNARNNRAEIVKALSIGQITRRDLYKWGLLTFGGLAVKNGLSPFARSAFAAVPTGTPRSPLFNAQKFTQPRTRPHSVTPPSRPVPARRCRPDGCHTIPTSPPILPTRDSSIPSPEEVRSRAAHP